MLTHKRRLDSVRPDRTATQTTDRNILRGDTILFLYPQYPFHGVASLLEPHFVRVSEIDDLQANPISREEFDRQPLLLRGRIRVVGTEVHTGAMVTFFADWMEQVQTLPRSVLTEQTPGVSE